jgi:hypothetical protein
MLLHHLFYEPWYKFLEYTYIYVAKQKNPDHLYHCTEWSNALHDGIMTSKHVGLSMVFNEVNK